MEAKVLNIEDLEIIVFNELTAEQEEEFSNGKGDVNGQ